jgi:hypothetical protein
MIGISAAVDIDVDVVDAQPGQGGHQVLDGGNLGAVPLQAGGQARIADAQCDRP